MKNGRSKLVLVAENYVDGEMIEQELKRQPDGSLKADPATQASVSREKLEQRRTPRRKP